VKVARIGDSLCPAGAELRGGQTMPLNDIISTAETSLNELHEIEWRCGQFAQQHMHSSERELRTEINRIAQESRVHHIDGTLDNRREKIGEALMRTAQRLIAAKRAPPTPAKFNSRGELKLELELRPKHPLHFKHGVPHAATRGEQDTLEHQVAEERRLERAAHERHLQELAKALAEDDETFYLHFTRLLAASEEAKLQDELARANGLNAAPLDEDKIVTLMASMLNYSQEADMMRRRLNAKYGIRIAGEGFDAVDDVSNADAPDDSKAWDDIDAVSPRNETIMETVAAACTAIARQRIARLRARLALRQPLGKFDAGKEKQKLADLLAAEKAAGLSGGDEEAVLAMMPPILKREMAQILRTLRSTESEVWNLREKIKQEDREKQNQRVIVQLKTQLRLKLKEILSLRVKYRDDDNQLDSLGEGRDTQQLNDDLRGDTAQAGSAKDIEKEMKELSRIQQTTPAWSKTK